MTPTIAYIIPTRNRPECLARTLAAMGSLPPHSAEVIVVDNAGEPPASVPFELANGLGVTLIMRSRNDGAAGRNSGARAASPDCEWLVMLDDDSYPLDLGFLDALREQPEDVAAVCAEIFLPEVRHPLLGAMYSPREAGGLPEVPVGCGVAYRRRVFVTAEIADTAGYDPRFGFYAEEYDLAARLIRAGHRIVLDRRFVVRHEKTPAGRSMDTILRRLVRNNAWVMQRYAPAHARAAEINRVVSRYARIAWKEHALGGYFAGLAELGLTLSRQARAEMSPRHWERFTGHAQCRGSLLRQWAQRRFDTAAIVHPGKNEHVVRECLEEIGVRLLADQHQADVVVIGTLSPGPMLDALESFGDRRGVVLPWDEPAGVPGLARGSQSRAAA